MSTLTTIQPGDLITNSRADINGNFSALNTDKMETSVLDTDTTLAANSDAKVATQKAVKAYVDAGGNVNASTTGKGIVEEATQAEVDAGTATGGTGARLFVNPATLRRPVLTLIPQPNFTPGDSTNDALKTLAVSSNTTAYLTQVVVPFSITVNSVSVWVNGVTAAGTLDLSLYSEDGQTQLFSVTTANISGAGVVTTAVSAVALAPGLYYMMSNTNSTTNVTIGAWYATQTGMAKTHLTGAVTSKPILNATLTITAGTPPTTITPAGLTANEYGSIAMRFDN